MTNTELAAFYERDLQKLIEEVNLFANEANLWKTAGSVKNSAGNLVLHITGGLNHHIGATLGKTGYVRQRDLEFADKNVPKATLVAGVEDLIITIDTTLKSIPEQDMNNDFPAFFDKPGTSVSYVVTQLLLHLNYHLGQVNYLRRALKD